MAVLRMGPVNAATPTPLNADYSLDKSSAKKLCRRWIDMELDGVLLLGSMGEGTMLSDQARNDFVELALEETGDKLTIYVCAADSSTARARERAFRYARMGAPCVVLCLAPKLSPAQAVKEVKEVAEACPVPCAYYDNPDQSGTPLVLNEILDILSHPNIKVLKDSSGNALINKMIASPEFHPKGVAVLDGNEYQTTSSRILGYDGVLHGGGVMTGKWIRRIWDLAGQGRIAEAEALDRRKALFLAKVYNRFSRPLQNAAGQKYCLHLLGCGDGLNMVNGQSLDEAGRARVKAAVDEYREFLV